MTKQRVSIKDIAEQAGVSVPTVSRALSGNGRVSASTRAQIQRLAEQLGYTPSLVARGLVTRRTNSVGVVVTNFADPFHSTVVQGIEAEAQRQAYSLFLASTSIDPEREVEVVRSFQGRQVDGILVSASRVGNRYVDLLQETGIPLVLINTHVASDNIHAVFHDDYQGMRQVVEHLVERGYRHIAYVGTALGGGADQARKLAWQAVLTEHGLGAQRWANGPNSRMEGGMAAVDDLLAQYTAQPPPEAICCYNDLMAIGVLAALRRQGLRTPADVAVTGFDDLEMAAYVEPPLTTLRQPRHALGVLAMRTLLTIINAPNQVVAPHHLALQGELVVRQTT